MVPKPMRRQVPTMRTRVAVVWMWLRIGRVVLGRMTREETRWGLGGRRERVLVRVRRVWRRERGMLLRACKRLWEAMVL